MKKILFIGATHGNEPIGVEVLKKLEKKFNNFDWIVGNPKALKQKSREYTADLNRSAPGDINSNQYEQKRAAEIIKLSKNYQYTIDIHGSGKPVGIFIIITNPKPINLKLAGMLPIKNIVFWPAFSPELKGPLSEFFSCGLEIECGPKENFRIKKSLEKKLEKFLINLKKIEKKPITELLKQKNIYKVYGNLKDKPNKKLKEFKEITINNETFYPLLIGSYKDKNIICYKMKKIK